MSSGLDRQVILQYTHDEWFSVTSPGLLINSLSSLKSWQEFVLAEMLPYVMAKSTYYFCMVVVSVLVLWLRLLTEISKSTLPPSHSVNIVSH